MAELRYFSAWDYVVFAAMLLISVGIGIYSAFSGGRQSTADEVLLGNRRLNPFAVGLSIMASTISAIAIIGSPAEIYVYNTMFAWIIPSYIPAYFFISLLFLPVYMKMNITSIFEYLEMRFNRPLRLFGTVVYILKSVLYMGVAIYTPALALNAVTGMNLVACIVSTAAVCTFYTAVGGMKAVVWTDTVQSCIMVIGVVAVIIKGSIEVGGFNEVVRLGVDGKRIELLETNPDPTIVYSVWSVLIGLGMQNLALGISQGMVQRLLACGSRKMATVALFVSMLAYMVILILCIISGVVMYAYYADCDPYTSGKVKSADQIMLLLVMDLFSKYPGLPGLFLAAVAGASLSTLSSGLNALAAVTGEDIIKTAIPHIDEKTYTRTLKALVFIYGLVSLLMAFLTQLVGQGVLQLTLSIGGLTAGGMMGVFLLGIYFHRTNTWGAFAGLISSLLVVGWIKVGSILHPSSRGHSPLSTEGCPAVNVTTVAPCMETTSSLFDGCATTPVPDEISGLIRMYQISYLYYTPIGLAIAVIVGIAVSGATGFTRPSDVDSRLKHNLTDALFFCFPERVKKLMRCGAEKSYIDKKEDEDKMIVTEADIVTKDDNWITSM